MSEATRRVRNVAELGARMRAYLTDEAHGGLEITDLVRHVGQIGEVAIFGGMPRDLARAGAAAFRSDVDLVVDTAPDRLAELFRGGSVEVNRFGGYRIAGPRHVYDIWALSSTWAVKAGHVEASCLADLVHTTFFDCDAVLYRCQAGRVHHSSHYETWLHECIVDVNLEITPNPTGAVERALRVILDWDHKPGPRLRQFLSRFANAPTTQLAPDTARRLATVVSSFAHELDSLTSR